MRVQLPMLLLEGQEPTGYSRFFESDPKKSCSRVQLVPGHMEVNSWEPAMGLVSVGRVALLFTFS